VTNQKVKRYYGGQTHESNTMIFVQQNMYASKAYCQDTTRSIQFHKSGANNMADHFNHTVAFDSPESMGDDCFLPDGRPINLAFSMYDLCEAILPRVRP